MLCRIDQEEEAMEEEAMGEAMEAVMEGAAAAGAMTCAYLKDHLQIPTGTGTGERTEDMDTYMPIECRSR